MTGLPVVLGNDRNANEVFMQAAGQGQCMKADALRKAIEKSVTLHRSMLRYVHKLLVDHLKANGYLPGTKAHKRK